MVVRILLILIFSLGTGQLQAQICNGSLGDPIVNISFGAGANPGAPLPAASTNYQYFSADCPQDGLYTIRNATSSCHGNTWHTVTDHTGNANGYFMLINASMQPSEFYLDTVRGLCGNTTYEFAAWVVNVLKPSSCGGAGIQPNLSFRIEKTDGTLLQQYNTGNIPQTGTPQWVQHGFYFTTPAAAGEVVLRLINNSQGGCGNDLGLDDITFRPCGPRINTSIIGEPATTVSICEGEARNWTFTANISSGFNSPVFQWQQSYNGAAWTDIAGATGPVYQKTFPETTPAGNHAFRVAAAEAGNLGISQCRVASVPLNVQVAANPATSITVNEPVCEGATLNLQVNAASANWTGPAGFAASGAGVSLAAISQAQSGMFRVTAINGSCTRKDSVFIQVQPRPSVTVSADTVHLCETDTAEIFISGADSYHWYPSAGVIQNGNSVLLFPADTSYYIFSGLSANGCADTVTVLVNTVKPPLADAGPDRSLVEGQSIRLNGQARGDGISYSWTPLGYVSPADSLQPLVYPVVNTSYRLRVESHLGCGYHEDTMQAHVFRKLGIPNAFSPNNDGVNDRWQIHGLDSYFNALVEVYDRWGRLVFNSQAFGGWDGSFNGKPLPNDAYYFLVRLPQGFAPVTGWVLVLR